MSIPMAVLVVVLGNAIYDTLWLVFLGDDHPDDHEPEERRRA